MADISALGNLNTGETLDESTYAPASSGSSFQLPKKGRYTVQAPEIADTAFGASQAGFLTAQVDPVLVDSGQQIRFTRVSAKTFNRGKGKASQMGDYLKAMLGLDTIPGDPQALADLIQSTSGRTCDVLIDWRVYNKNTGFSVEGMDNFPKDEKTGEPLPYVIDEKDINPETGEPRRLRANLNVVRWLPSNA